MILGHIFNLIIIFSLIKLLLVYLKESILFQASLEPIIYTCKQFWGLLKWQQLNLKLSYIRFCHLYVKLAPNTHYLNDMFTLSHILWISYPSKFKRFHLLVLVCGWKILRWWNSFRLTHYLTLPKIKSFTDHLNICEKGT